MSCIRSCYDKESPNFEHDDCKTCVHADKPPQRQWVGLSQKDIDELTIYPMNPTADLVKAIETKLKEKNT